MGNILPMSDDGEWLGLGLASVPEALAARVRLFRLTLATAGALRARLDRALAPSGVTTQQGALLQFVESRRSPPRLSEVARALEMSHQNARQIVAALERKGFVTLRPDPADRRARRVALTAKHRRFWRRRDPEDFSRVGAWTAALDDGEVRALLGLLGRMRDHLRAPEDPPAAGD